MPQHVLPTWGRHSLLNIPWAPSLVLPSALLVATRTKLAHIMWFLSIVVTQQNMLMVPMKVLMARGFTEVGNLHCANKPTQKRKTSSELWTWLSISQICLGIYTLLTFQFDNLLYVIGLLELDTTLLKVLLFCILCIQTQKSNKPLWQHESLSPANWPHSIQGTHNLAQVIAPPSPMQDLSDSSGTSIGNSYKDTWRCQVDKVKFA